MFGKPCKNEFVLISNERENAGAFLSAWVCFVFVFLVHAGPRRRAVAREFVSSAEGGGAPEAGACGGRGGGDPRRTRRKFVRGDGRGPAGGGRRPGWGLAST